MNFLARKVLAVRFQKWFAGESLAHRRIVVIVLAEALFENIRDELGQAGILTRRLDTRSPSQIVFQRDRDIP
jgi:hypothetical protein